MEKTTEIVMSTAITILVPLAILYLQETLARRKEARELASKQARRDESLSADICTLKSTVERSTTVLEDVRDDLIEVRERLVRVETKVSP